MQILKDIPVSSPPASAPAKDVVNDGFFPDISLASMREAMRLDATVTDARLRPAIIAAMASTNQLLAGWQQAQRAAGWNTLAAVPAVQLDGESLNLALYRRAVYSFAKADLFEGHRDIDTTASSLTDRKSMDWMDLAPEVQRRNAHWAVNDILGRPHATVELI